MVVRRRFPDARVAVIKAGPDFIDPMFHSLSAHATGNIDIFFSGADGARAVFESDTRGCSLAIVEGSMGYFDGVSGGIGASAFEVASALGSPVILVFDAKGRSMSLCAEILGFMKFRPSDRIAGVILNRCSRSRYALLSDMIRKECGVGCLGFLEEDEGFSVGSRHLGLMTPETVPGIGGKMEMLAARASETLDIDGILRAASFSEASVECAPVRAEPGREKVRIAVARDDAFCFYYRENLDMLRAAGAGISFFSPLADEEVPEGCSALYIGGGYPELFFSRLADNSRSSSSVRRFCGSGAPVFAECGGFLYLQMLGILGGSFRNEGKPVRFGYIELEALEDSFLMEKGGRIKAHEFHYFDTSENGSSFRAVKGDGRSWMCIRVSSPSNAPRCRGGERNIVAGFPHLYFPSNPAVAERFVEAALVFESMRGLSCAGCSSCGKGGCPHEK